MSTLWMLRQMGFRPWIAWQLVCLAARIHNPQWVECPMSAAGKIPKLANPKSPAVLAALRIPCPTCKAAPQQRCRGLNYRIVHFARCTFKEIP